jgi:hypothetical protein
MPRRKRRQSDPFADIFATIFAFFGLAVIGYFATHRDQLMSWVIALLPIFLAGVTAFIIIRKLKNKNAPLDWDDDKILRMLKGGTPAQFEREIANMFEALSYQTQVFAEAQETAASTFGPTRAAGPILSNAKSL